MTRLIDNVLEFSKLEKKSHPLELSAGSLEVPVREILQILEPHARACGFALSLEVEEDLPVVSFHRDALQQILFNLVDNALKYAREAERKEVQIRCERNAEGVLLAVYDFGPGVASEHQPHLFEAFYRGEQELTRRTKGTGIGLALVRGLAEQMNARVEAGNIEAVGFEVRVLFCVTKGAL